MYGSLRKTEKASTQLEMNAGARNRVRRGWRDSKVDGCMDGNYVYICTADVFMCVCMYVCRYARTCVCVYVCMYFFFICTVLHYK